MASLRVVDSLFSLESSASFAHIQACGDPAARCVAAMDAAGVEIAVVAPCRRWKCERHWVCGDIQVDEVLQTVQSYPDRFAGLAAYNPYAIQESVHRIDAALRGAGFRGVYIPDTGNEVRLVDRRMYPLYAECSEAGATAMIEMSNDVLADLPTLVRDFDEMNIVLVSNDVVDVTVLRPICERFPSVMVAFDGRVLPGQQQSFASWLQAEGRTRCIWGSNGAPWEISLNHVRSYSLPEPVFTQFVRENAWRIFRLRTEPEISIFPTREKIVVAE